MASTIRSRRPAERITRSQRVESEISSPSRRKRSTWRFRGMLSANLSTMTRAMSPFPSMLRGRANIVGSAAVSTVRQRSQAQLGRSTRIVTKCPRRQSWRVEEETLISLRLPPQVTHVSGRVAAMTSSGSLLGLRRPCGVTAGAGFGVGAGGSEPVRHSPARRGATRRRESMLECRRLDFRASKTDFRGGSTSKANCDVIPV